MVIVNLVDPVGGQAFCVYDYFDTSLAQMTTGQAVRISGTVAMPLEGKIGLAENCSVTPSEAQADHPWLGVRIQEVTPEIAESLGLPTAKGALVAGLTPDGPAEKIGIKQGDVIEAYNGHDIVKMHDLPLAVTETQIGQKAIVKLWRNGREMTLAPTIVAMSNNPETLPSVAPTLQAPIRASPPDQNPQTALPPPPPLPAIVPADVCAHPELSSTYDGLSHENAVRICVIAEQNALNQLYRLTQSPVLHPIVSRRLYRCSLLAQGWATTPHYYESMLGCVAGNMGEP